MRRLALGTILAASMVGACEFDLTPVQRRTQATLSLQLHVGGLGGPLHVRASVHPGFVDSGRARELSDDSLRINGVAVAPTEVTQAGTRVYTISGLDPSNRLLRFEPPALVELPEAPEVTVPRFEVLAPDTVIARRDGKIELLVSGGERIFPEGLNGNWSLDVYADACAGARVLSTTGYGPPPPVLGLAVALLPQELSRGGLHVQAYVWQQSSSPGGSYDIRVGRSFSTCIPFRVTE